MSFLPIEIAAAAKLEVVFPNGARVSLSCQDHEVIRTVLSSLLVAETSAPREGR